MRVTRLIKMMALTLIFAAFGSFAMAQYAHPKDRAVSQDQAKQDLLTQQAESPYENPKHERFERIANNDLTPEMRVELEAAKQQKALEYRLEKLIALRDKAIENGDPTGKYDAEISTIEEDLQ